MCIARVGKALSVAGGKARVEFFDGKQLDGVDVSLVGAGPGEFVEVFGNLALSKLSAPDARKRIAAWREVKKAALLSAPKG